MAILTKKGRNLFNNVFLLSLLVVAASCTTIRHASVKTDRVNTVISTSRSYVGTPYRYGGTTNNGMDCSGLLMISFKSVDISIPRTALDQSKIGKPVAMQQLKPGDLVFFAAKNRSRKVTHAGLVTEVNGMREIKFIHASSSRGVIEDNLYSKYYQKVFVKARRPVF